MTGSEEDQGEERGRQGQLRGKGDGLGGRCALLDMPSR